MPILPVIDLMYGHVVRGIGGRREEYRPIVSKLTQSTHPLDVARALNEHFGFLELYVADLDAIAGSPPAWEFYEELVAHGFRPWIDRGIRTMAEVGSLYALGVATMVVALETVRGPDTLDEVCRRFGPDRVVFSLDMRDGRPLGDLRAWRVDTPWEIAQGAVEAGANRLLLLDLASVGVGVGPSTAELCGRLRRAYPYCEVATGGGVRGPDDVRGLYAAGASYVLIASALHDGRLSAADVAELQRHG
jgi:phosphoribosylformimino-5-aminoimidazole carboxamide ribotide isomerase